MRIRDAYVELAAAGFRTRATIEKVKRTMVDVEGHTHGAWWSLQPDWRERWEASQRASAGNLEMAPTRVRARARAEANAGWRARHPEPRRPRQCRKCGTPIGARGPGEPDLCFAHNHDEPFRLPRVWPAEEAA